MEFGTVWLQATVTVGKISKTELLFKPYIGFGVLVRKETPIFFYMEVGEKTVITREELEEFIEAMISGDRS